MLTGSNNSYIITHLHSLHQILVRLLRSGMKQQSIPNFDKRLYKSIALPFKAPQYSKPSMNYTPVDPYCVSMQNTPTSSNKAAINTYKLVYYCRLPRFAGFDQFVSSDIRKWLKDNRSCNLSISSMSNVAWAYYNQRRTRLWIFLKKSNYNHKSKVCCKDN